MFLVSLVLTFGVGTLAGVAAKKMRVPAGMMIGSMLGVILFNVVTNTDITFPSIARTIIQMGSGTVIGSQFTKKDLAQLKTMAKPAALLIGCLFGFNLLFTYFIASLSSLNSMTALFASAPGGVSDLALIAEDFQADTQQVAVLQLVRFIFVLSFFPLYFKKKYKQKLVNFKPKTKSENMDSEPDLKEASGLVWKAMTTLLAGAVGGSLFQLIGVPAGAVIGAIAGVLLLNCTIAFSSMPVVVKSVVQIAAGCYIGSRVNRELLFSIGELLLPMLLILIEVLVMSFSTAFIIHKVTGLSLDTSLFSSIPGGIAEMGLIADDMGLDTPKIIVMHTCRVIAIICFLPLFVRLLA